ncbi:BZ3500_MvSof-1268-A1-R1_Chr8-1g10049 [Microbotryum saponariae]|uniref:BZ3500_MvSof-1268-A1-R1_Chr8-1g10049 protein n=1 Tax=Microbotryum saponariae TaxID=289078 RepID=A0A2X0LME7_9BASI|nr:BZ3500_MvSof-1268-A1-R1_Chr8-1g10049 [Microbotryum saponariae]SDA08334.1 BZ3501_MvSof-1269-A2-R1_Chr8-1g09771 [Microbotryum saponariae]
MKNAVNQVKIIRYLKTLRPAPAVFDQLYYVSDVVIAKSDQCISTYLFDQLYYVSDVVIAKSDE